MATFRFFDMISILRDDQSGICMIDESGRGYTSTGSQVSVLTSGNRKKSQIDGCHFFTGTPNPKVSLFKPFIFSDKVQLGPCDCFITNRKSPHNVFIHYILHIKKQHVNNWPINV